MFSHVCVYCVGDNLIIILSPVQAKGKTGLRQVATLLLQELGTRFAEVLDPKSVIFDPVQ